MPFIMGLLIAYLFYIPCRKVESWYTKSTKFVRKKARILSIITVYIIAVLLIILVLNLLFCNIKKYRRLCIYFGIYYNNTMNAINELPEDSILKDETVLNAIKGIGEVDIKQYLNFEKLTEYAKGAINVVNSIFDVFVSLIVSVYLLAERRKILEFFKRLTSALFKKDKYELIAKYFNKQMKYFSVLFLVKF